MSYEVIIIGGGPAGLAAALSADKAGAKVLLIEREERLGGILKQCIHDGFGLVRFKEKLSGPEYAERFVSEFYARGIEARLNSFVTNIEKLSDGFRLTLSSSEGLTKVEGKALVLATGCRERTARQVGIHGTRPAGIFSAGTAQNYINLLGEQVAKRAVILGSGDIGLIMARRLTLEGAQVLGCYEILPYPSGLARNVRQCLEDFGIPLHLSTTVTKVFGTERVEAVEVAKVDEKLNPIPETEEIIPCDTLIVSVGLIPENELAESLGVAIDPKTKGPGCDMNYQTSVPGVFSCGNSYHVFDLVDYVSESGEAAGQAAAEYAKNGLPETEARPVVIPPKKAITPGAMVCIGCPRGCELFVTTEADGSLSVTGNRCPKGKAFAEEETKCPARVLTTSVKTVFPERPVLSVRTEKEIPKNKLFDAMQIVNQYTLDHIPSVGEVLIENLADTGVSLIATGTVG